MAGLEQENKGKKDPERLRGFILCRIEDRMRTLVGKSKRAEVRSVLNVVNFKNLGNIPIDHFGHLDSQI